MIDRFVSSPMDLAPGVLSGEYTRADLIFDNVDHSLASYEAQIFLNHPDATVEAGRESDSYAGSFFVFGHGGCFGDQGHCEVPEEPRDPFDLRPPHQLIPVTKVVIITEPLRRAVGAAPTAHQLTVTVVCFAPDQPGNDYLQFSRLRLLAYR